MRILAADDELIPCKQLTDAIRLAAPNAELHAFERPKELLVYAETHPADVAFLDIEMGSMTGIEVAKQLKLWYPKINLIFVTAYQQYMSDAFRLHASGYVEKPVSADAISVELENLRVPVLSTRENMLTAKCFGTFDVFVNGKSLDFERKKSKELLAYLIDRRGCSVTSGELRTILWEDSGNEKAKGTYLQVLKKDLLQTLKKAGVSDVLNFSWNKYAIDKTKICCDYYDYLDDKPEGVRAYNGEYMSQYSWAELGNVTLSLAHFQK